MGRGIRAIPAWVDGGAIWAGASPHRYAPPMHNKKDGPSKWESLQFAVRWPSRRGPDCSRNRNPGSISKDRRNDVSQACGGRPARAAEPRGCSSPSALQNGNHDQTLLVLAARSFERCGLRLGGSTPARIATDNCSQARCKPERLGPVVIAAPACFPTPLT